MPYNRNAVTRIIKLCANEGNGCNSLVRFRMASAIAQDSYESEFKPQGIKPEHTVARIWADDLMVDMRYK